MVLLTRLQKCLKYIAKLPHLPVPLKFIKSILHLVTMSRHATSIASRDSKNTERYSVSKKCKIEKHECTYIY